MMMNTVNLYNHGFIQSEQFITFTTPSDNFVID